MLHRLAGGDAEGITLDMDGGDAVDQEHRVVVVVAVIGIDARLADDLEGVLAPVLDVDEGVVKRDAVVAGEATSFEKVGGGSGAQVAPNTTPKKTKLTLQNQTRTYPKTFS